MFPGGGRASDGASSRAVVCRLIHLACWPIQARCTLETLLLLRQLHRLCVFVCRAERDLHVFSVIYSNDNDLDLRSAFQGSPRTLYISQEKIVDANSPGRANVFSDERVLNKCF